MCRQWMANEQCIPKTHAYDTHTHTQRTKQRLHFIRKQLFNRFIGSFLFSTHYFQFLIHFETLKWKHIDRVPKFVEFLIDASDVFVCVLVCGHIKTYRWVLCTFQTDQHHRIHIQNNERLRLFKHIACHTLWKYITRASERTFLAKRPFIISCIERISQQHQQKPSYAISQMCER